jgi:protocatechuate 3,4-dioxygenase beta subunit
VRCYFCGCYKDKQHQKKVTMKRLLTIIWMGVFLTGFVFQSTASGDEDKDKTKTVNTASLKGQVVDKQTGETITGAKIIIKGKKQIAAYSDFEGNFQIQGLKPGKYEIETSFISYKDEICDNIKLEVDDKNNLTIKLESLEE